MVKGNSNEQGHLASGPPPWSQTAPVQPQGSQTVQASRIGTDPANAADDRPAFTTVFASVSLHGIDRIRLLQLPLEVIDAVRNVICETWAKGIQAEHDHHGALEFKLRGNPWPAANVITKEEFANAHRMTRGIMASLYALGWVLYISPDISTKTADHATMIFRHQDPAPAPCEWFSCAFKSSDRLRLIDAPHEVRDDVVKALQQYTRNHGPYTLAGVYKIKFNGNPFGSVTMESHKIAMQLFSVFEKYGYTMYASINQSTAADNRRIHSWHLARSASWQAGTPVYHR